MAAILTGAARSAVKNKITPTLQTGGIHSWPLPMDVFYVYYTFGVIIFGIIGNFISTVLFAFQQPGTTNKENHYLQMLSISNSLYLLNLMLTLFRVAKVIGPGLNGGCLIDTYLSLLFNSASTFTIIFFGIEYLLLKVYPQHVAKMKLLKDNYLIIIAIPLLASMITGSIAFQEVYMSNACYNNSTYSDAPIFNSKHASYSLSIFLTVVIVISLWTVVGRCRLEHQPSPPVEHRRVYSSRECREVWYTLNRLALEEQSSDLWAPYTEAHTLMWLVTKTFIAMTLPACVGSFIFDVDKSEVPSRWVALQRLLMMLFNTNFGINFFLYCLSGQNFRKELWIFISFGRSAPAQPRLVRRDTPRFNNVISDSVDSRSTYRQSNVPTTSNADDDFYFPPPSGEPTTPRHEIMELVDLPMRRP